MHISKIKPVEGLKSTRHNPPNPPMLPTKPWPGFDGTFDPALIHAWWWRDKIKHDRVADAEKREQRRLQLRMADAMPAIAWQAEHDVDGEPALVPLSLIHI